MSNVEGLRVTISQEVTLDQLSDLIVGGLYYHEILTLISLVVEKKNREHETDDFTDVVINEIRYG